MSADDELVHGATSQLRSKPGRATLLTQNELPTDLSHGRLTWASAATAVRRPTVLDQERRCRWPTSALQRTPSDETVRR